MKYLKIFEEFNSSKYEVIKELPNKAAIMTSDPDELICIKNYLETKSYKFKKETGWGRDDQIHRDYIENAKKGLMIGVFWVDKNNKDEDVFKFTQIGDYVQGMITKGCVLEEFYARLNFDEYFKLKHDYRGLNLRKKFNL